MSESIRWMHRTTVKIIANFGHFRLAKFESKDHFHYEVECERRDYGGQKSWVMTSVDCSGEIKHSFMDDLGLYIETLLNQLPKENKNAK